MGISADSSECLQVAKDVLTHPAVQATERCKQKIIERRAYYSTNERPDVWFEPTEVWEIRGADLTLSAVHKSAFGLIHPTRGVSLRSVHIFFQDTVLWHSRPLSSSQWVSGRPLYCLW